MTGWGVDRQIISIAAHLHSLRQHTRFLSPGHCNCQLILQDFAPTFFATHTSSQWNAYFHFRLRLRPTASLLDATMDCELISILGIKNGGEVLFAFEALIRERLAIGLTTHQQVCEQRRSAYRCCQDERWRWRDCLEIHGTVQFTHARVFPCGRPSHGRPPPTHPFAERMLLSDIILQCSESTHATQFAGGARKRILRFCANVHSLESCEHRHSAARQQKCVGRATALAEGGGTSGSPCC